MPALASEPAVGSVRRRILAWYAADHRELPFRRSRDRWPVLVAEVMLQQTQAARIAERFDAFMDRFPSAATMAAATPADVIAAWSGLGYNRRALNLHAAATEITRSGWPATVEGLERLPGIGPYSARAVASIALGQPVGAVDTNVRRWLVRRFAAEPGDARALQDLADSLAVSGRPNREQAGTWTHATMEFGARICSARSPRCDLCPVARGCPSRANPARVPVPRQNGATATTRAARGALLRALAAAPGHRLSQAQARRLVGGTVDAADYEALTEGLARDGLLHRSGRSLVLGPG
ncbi:MAG TPA: A/G-specific adenine glycosylase [Candidatus Limnocylindria bacterium]|nr:A/G-specific adenine glycosylase [Candidatus Limnocylindria bacterium]